MKTIEDGIGLVGVGLLAAGLLFGCAGCMDDGKDGAPGATGPTGPTGDQGESYVSTTNPVTGEVTTIAVTGATSGDNSPVSIDININTGTDGSAGDRNPNPPAVDPVATVEE